MGATFTHSRAKAHANICRTFGKCLKRIHCVILWQWTKLGYINISRKGKTQDNRWSIYLSTWQTGLKKRLNEFHPPELPSIPKIQNFSGRTKIWDKWRSDIGSIQVLWKPWNSFPWRNHKAGKRWDKWVVLWGEYVKNKVRYKTQIVFFNLKPSY